MNGFELNKIAGAVLMVGIIAILVGKVTDALYQPERDPEKRGYEIAGAVAETVVADAVAAEPAKPVDIAEFMTKADAKAGEALAKKCAICHDFTAGGPNKIGPNLHGIVGKEMGKHEGFAYSAVMKSHGGKWDEQTLSEFLTAPAKYMKGTKMAFVGLAKPEDRANMIAYLESLK